MCSAKGSHCCQNVIQDLLQAEADDPGPPHVGIAVFEVNCRHAVRD